VVGSSELLHGVNLNSGGNTPLSSRLEQEGDDNLQPTIVVHGGHGEVEQYVVAKPEGEEGEEEFPTTSEDMSADN